MLKNDYRKWMKFAWTWWLQVKKLGRDAWCAGPEKSFSSEIYDFESPSDDIFLVELCVWIVLFLNCEWNHLPANDWCCSCDQNLSLFSFWVMPFLIDISISTGKSLSIRNSCYWCLFDLQLRQSSNQIFTYWTFDAVGERREVPDVTYEASVRDKDFDKQILFVIFARIELRQTLRLSPHSLIQTAQPES